METYNQQVKENLTKLAKLIFSVLLSIILSVFCVAQSYDDSLSKKDDFLRHFDKLALAVKSNPKDTIYHCCSGSILYMEFSTKLFAKADGTFFGKLYFTKSEFIRWKIWGIRKGWINMVMF